MIPIIIGAAAIGLILLAFFLPRKRKVNHPYLEALNCLLSGRREEAIKYLREAVRIDSENIDAYLRLGDLWRQQGDGEKALRIHQSLTVRSGLTKEMRKRIDFALALDYLAMGNHKRAIAILKELVRKSKDRDALDYLLKIFEDEGQFIEAIEFLKEGGKRLVDRRRQAIYYLMAGKDLLERDPKRGEDYLKEAHKLSSNSPMVLATLAELDHKAKRFDLALGRWQKLLWEYPDLLMAVKDRLENTYFEANRYGDIEGLYEQVLNRHQYNIPVSLALIRIYQKKGENNKLKSILERLKEYRARLLLPRLIELDLHLGSGPARELLERLIDEGEPFRYHCSVCGKDQSEFTWRCPNCGAWESLRPSFLF